MHVHMLLYAPVSFVRYGKVACCDNSMQTDQWRCIDLQNNNYFFLSSGWLEDKIRSLAM